MEEKGKTIQCFEMDIEQDGDRKIIAIQAENGIFKIIHNGRIIGALKPPGEEWQLLPFEEITDKIPVFEIDFQKKNKEVELHAPLVNQIVGQIENYLK